MFQKIKNTAKHKQNTGILRYFITCDSRRRGTMKKSAGRNTFLLRISAALFIVGLWLYFSSVDLSYNKPTDGIRSPSTYQIKGGKESGIDSIMPSMPEQEAKEALGRASWKYFHTLLARFPDDPSEEEKQKLRSFLQLYAELYPCGECSHHFVKMLEKYPPQVSSRVTAAIWGCHIHNKVNEYLKKPEYDCSTVLENYDCGCGDEDGKVREDLKLNNKVTLEKEGIQRG
ncbi:hypothetical protein HG535_0B05200 [Zygotorulaspora mrakii]|uniref:Sulfhydryl oxidase n=1 Tax=Zygotorulaspora mrakii TaxID=42260 RepID=A0A7H9AYJ6_ZYGMR|nr:uncharacterized protein HG535_0B05200 [Zygotorulaspora mrakii]QLG71478.1 hypothetical protein HG535_0B05200 [Zygotorulaspora mrakii]